MVWLSGRKQTIPIPTALTIPKQRGCARGRSQRRQVFGADRLKYPMKRKNWAPGGGKKELRGRDEWVRISWDEALDIVASELKRIKENYGNEVHPAPSNQQPADECLWWLYGLLGSLLRKVPGHRSKPR